MCEKIFMLFCYLLIPKYLQCCNIFHLEIFWKKYETVDSKSYFSCCNVFMHIAQRR